MRALFTCAAVVCILAVVPRPAGAGEPASQGERDGPPVPGVAPEIPVRERRPWAIALELGNKGIGGLGLVGTYNARPHLALDMGTGVSVLGWKLGGRVRYDFLESRWTPYVALGGLVATGTGSETVTLRLHSDSSRFRVRPSSFLQLAGGINYTGKRGFTFMSTVGYGLLLGDRDNVVLVSGHELSKHDKAGLAGSGLILAFSAGYAF